VLALSHVESPSLSAPKEKNERKTARGAAEERKFDRAVALFAKNETRHKLGTTPSKSVASE
jgi:hypothetical protein